MATTCIFLPSTPKFSHSSSRSTSAVTRSSLTDQSQSPAAAAKRRLLSLISGQERGLKTQSNPQTLSQIVDAIDSLAAVGRGSVTTDESLSATWRMLWTTEKEQLFIIRNAPVFGSAAGDVLQVIDVEKKTLNNVITFPPDGVFFVRSDIQVASAQRVNFQFTSAVLRGKGWEFPLPPFGQGWYTWRKWSGFTWKKTLLRFFF